MDDDTIFANYQDEIEKLDEANKRIKKMWKQQIEFLVDALKAADVSKKLEEAGIGDGTTLVNAVLEFAYSGTREGGDVDTLLAAIHNTFPNSQSVQRVDKITQVEHIVDKV